MAHKQNILRKELAAANTAELQQRLADEKKNLFTLRYQKDVHPFENTMRIREVRKLIARLHTLLRQRALQSDGSVGKEA